jgi:hypothetical protein
MRGALVLDVLRRVSITRARRPFGLPALDRGADEFWNPCLILDVPPLCNVALFHGRFERRVWWSLGWSHDDRIIYISPDGLLAAGIAPAALGIDGGREFHPQLEATGLGTLPAHVVLRLADWMEPSGAAEEEIAHPDLEGVAGRRRLSA